jgi:hypothetical protein
MKKSKNVVILSVICHCQNPLESICNGFEKVEWAHSRCLKYRSGHSHFGRKQARVTVRVLEDFLGGFMLVFYCSVER